MVDSASKDRLMGQAKAARRRRRGRIENLNGAAGDQEDADNRRRGMDNEVYKILFESAPDGIYLADMDGNFVDVNKAAEKLAGCGRDELVGKNIAEIEFLSPEETVKALARLEKAAAGKPVGPEEFTIRKKDGEEVTVEIRTFPVTIQGQELSLGIARDITERKREEEELRESEKNLHLIYDVVGDVIFQLAVEPNDCFRFVTVNQSFLDATGLTEEQVVGKRIGEVIPEPSRGLVLEKYRQAIRTKKAVIWEETSIYPSGVKTGDVTIAPVFNEEAICTHLIGSVHDITERKQAEEALQESEQRYRTIFDSSRDAIFITAEDAGFVEVNEAASVLTGYSREELTKMTIPELHEEEDTRAYTQFFHRIMSGEQITSEAKILRKDGTKVDTEFSNRKIMIDNAAYMHTIARDITERKRAQQKLLEDREQLKSLASQLSITEERERHGLATVLHDQIGQSLVFSKLKLDMLRKSASSEEFAEALEEVCNNLGQVIDDTRTLTFDLSSPILYELGLEAAVDEWLRDEIKDKHGIETEFEDDLQSKPLDDDIRAVLFRNVRELLVNIVKHAQARKVKVCVRRVDGSIRVSVEDDGVDFDPVDVTSRAAKGAKFGLFSIRQRLEQLGGVIEIASTPGRGCTISMTAPLKQDNDGIALHD